MGKWHLTGDYDAATAEGRPISPTAGAMPPGTGGFECTRFMFGRHSHPKAALDRSEHARRCHASNSSMTNCALDAIRGVRRAGGGSECGDTPIQWLNPQSTALLLSNEVPCTDAHLHSTTRALSRWAWQLLDAHMRGDTHRGACGRVHDATRPAFLLLSLPDPHPSVGGYVAAPPYDRHVHEQGASSSSAAADVEAATSSTAAGSAAALMPFEPPASYRDATPIVTTDAKPLALTQHELRRSSKWRGAPALAHLRRLRAGYLGMVREIDDAIGRLVDSLSAARLLEDTLYVRSPPHAARCPLCCLYRSRVI